MTKIIKFEYQEQIMRPSYGGSKIIISYFLVTECYGVVNNYEVDAEVRGIHDASPYLSMYECRPLHNNEATLTEEAITDLLEW